MVGQSSFKPVKRFIDTIIDAIIFRSQGLRIIIAGSAPNASNSELNMRRISEDPLLTIVPFDLSHGTGTDAW
ncbi:MAG: hypothetical protein CMB79_10180 [Filomicrobium sp.]|nr:hypothetical protein [Filomicrobium sp.]